MTMHGVYYSGMIQYAHIKLQSIASKLQTLTLSSSKEVSESKLLTYSMYTIQLGIFIVFLNNLKHLLTLAYLSSDFQYASVAWQIPPPQGLEDLFLWLWIRKLRLFFFGFFSWNLSNLGNFLLVGKYVNFLETYMLQN